MLSEITTLKCEHVRLSQQINHIFSPSWGGKHLERQLKWKKEEEYIHKCTGSCSPAAVLDVSHEKKRFAQWTGAKPPNVSTNYICTLITWICTGLSSSVHRSSVWRSRPVRVCNLCDERQKESLHMMKYAQVCWRCWRTRRRPPDGSDRKIQCHLSIKVNNSKGN